jgi:hypothetical protein
MEGLSQDSLGRKCNPGSLPLRPTSSVYVHVNLLTLILAMLAPEFAQHSSNVCYSHVHVCRGRRCDYKDLKGKSRDSLIPSHSLHEVT